LGVGCLINGGVQYLDNSGSFRDELKLVEFVLGAVSDRDVLALVGIHRCWSIRSKRVDAKSWAKKKIKKLHLEILWFSERLIDYFSRCSSESRSCPKSAKEIRDDDNILFWRWSNFITGLKFFPPMLIFLEYSNCIFHFGNEDFYKNFSSQALQVIIVWERNSCLDRILLEIDALPCWNACTVTCSMKSLFFCLLKLITASDWKTDVARVSEFLIKYGATKWEITWGIKERD